MASSPVGSPVATTKYSSMTYHFPAVSIVPTCDKEALTSVTKEDIVPESSTTCIV